MCFFSVLFIACRGAQAEQHCDSVPENTPGDSFTVNTDGTVTHNTTGLMWARCASGQTWDESNQSCTGIANQVTWVAALTLANTTTFAGYTDWRLPNIKELSSIVERMCVEPSINLSLFPNTPSENFWTSTTLTNEPTRAWSFAFYNGKNNSKDKSVDLFLRFVRFEK